MVFGETRKGTRMSTWIGIFSMDLQKWNLGAGSKQRGDKQTIKGPGPFLRGARAANHVVSLFQGTIGIGVEGISRADAHDPILGTAVRLQEAADADWRLSVAELRVVDTDVAVEPVGESVIDARTGLPNVRPAEVEGLIWDGKSAILADLQSGVDRATDQSVRR